MTEKQFQEFIKKFDRHTRLVAIALLADKKQQDQITLLSQAGLQPKEIAELLGTTPNTVRVTLSTKIKNKKRS